MQVGIYLETDTKSPRRVKRKCGYVLACVIDGKTITRDGIFEEETTYHGAQLAALEKALARIRKKSEVTIHTEDPWILTQIETNLKAWAIQDFLNAKGNPIPDQKRWLHVWVMIQNHSVNTECGRHSYSLWMRERMKTWNKQ